MNTLSKQEINYKIINYKIIKLKLIKNILVYQCSHFFENEIKEMSKFNNIKLDWTALDNIILKIKAIEQDIHNLKENACYYT